MEKWTRHLTSGIDRIQQRTQALLENESAEKITTETPAFEASRDQRLIDGLPLQLPDDLVDRAIVIFGRLAGLFEAGILLEKEGGRWFPRARFHQGVPRSMSVKAHSFQFPDCGPLQVLQTPARPLLAKLELQHLDPKNLLTGNLVRHVPEFSYLLFSALPDVWLKNHMEQITEALSRGFAE